MAKTREELTTKIKEVINQVTEFPLTKVGGEEKNKFMNLCKQLTTGYGRTADDMESLKVLRSLVEEIKEIKKKDYEIEGKFEEALQDQKTSILTAANESLNELETLKDESFGTDKATGNMGDRSRFEMTFYPKDGSEPVSITSVDIARGFIASDYIKKNAQDPNVILANCLRDYIEDELKMDYFNKETEKEKGKIFFKLYRLIRPANMKAINEIRKGLDPTTIPARIPREKAPKQKPLDEQGKAPKKSKAKGPDQDLIQQDIEPGEGDE